MKFVNLTYYIYLHRLLLLSVVEVWVCLSGWKKGPTGWVITKMAQQTNFKNKSPENGEEHVLVVEIKNSSVIFPF